MPFILRNVRLQGVDSVMCPTENASQRGKNWLSYYQTATSSKRVLK